MMNKRIMAALVVVAGSSLAACGGSPEEGGETVEGRYASSHYVNSGLYTFFVKDNVAGKEYRTVQFDHEMNFEDYEAEAYVLNVTEKTELIDGETGEKIEIEDERISPFEYPNQRIEVEFHEGFQRETLSRDEHISYDQHLLPVVEPASIKIFEYSQEDYIGFLQPLQDTSYIYMMTGGSTNQDYHPYIYQILHTINENTEYNFTFTTNNPHSYSYMDSGNEDEYLIISSEGIVHKSTERQEAEAFIEDLIGTEFPYEETDPMEWEVN